MDAAGRAKAITISVRDSGGREGQPILDQNAGKIDQRADKADDKPDQPERKDDAENVLIICALQRAKTLSMSGDPVFKPIEVFAAPQTRIAIR